MTKLYSVVGKYLAFLVVLLAGWAAGALKGASDLSVLATGPALVSLVLVLAPWLSACALHYVTTGDPSPVAPDDHDPKPHPSPPPPPPSFDR